MRTHAHNPAGSTTTSKVAERRQGRPTCAPGHPSNTHIHSHTRAHTHARAPTSKPKKPVDTARLWCRGGPQRHRAHRPAVLIHPRVPAVRHTPLRPPRRPRTPVFRAAPRSTTRTRTRTRRRRSRRSRRRCGGGGPTHGACGGAAGRPQAAGRVLRGGESAWWRPAAGRTVWPRRAVAGADAGGQGGPGRAAHVAHRHYLQLGPCLPQARGHTEARGTHTGITATLTLTQADTAQTNPTRTLAPSHSEVDTHTKAHRPPHTHT
jgi:hypothetical protein